MGNNNRALFLGIDVGTQGARVGVCASDGSLLSVASASYETFFPRPGWAEQDPREWWRSICEASRACLLKGSIESERIEGISFDATSSTVVMVDHDGEPLDRAILWMDQRAVAEVDEIARTGHPFLKYVGGRDSVEWMVPKAMWLKKHEPDLFQKSWKLVEATDWIAFKLSGAWSASLCNATCKCNYVTVEGGWSESFFSDLGASDLPVKWLQRVVPMGVKIGKLTSEAAQQMGLRSGIPIAEGGIDAHVGLLGLNALESSRMGLILGSSTVMFVLQDSPVYSSRFWGPYPDAILKGTWLVEAGQTSTGSIINWMVQNFGLAKDGADKETLIAELEEEAAALPAGSSGLVMLDYWQGNRTPRRDPRAKGVIFGLTLAHDYRHLVRSAYEGIVFGTRHIIDSLREEGIEVQTASAGGGGVKSKIWLQLTSDVCGIPITVPRYAGACGVVGAAILAACASGFYSSLREAASRMVSEDRTIVPSGDAGVYAESYGRYRDLYEKTKELL